MAIVTIDQITKEIQTRQFAPVYFLQGEEAYFIDKISDLIENNCIPLQEKDFNQTILYGKDVNLKTIIQKAKQYPMMADRTLVIIKEAQYTEQMEKEDQVSFFTSYLQNPLTSTVLVFCYKKKLDARKSLYKNITKYAKLVNSEPIKDYQIVPWIEKLLEQKKIKSTKSAVNLIAESIGNDLSRIESEINKIKINITEDQTLNEDIIEKYIGISKEYNVFELLKFIAKKDALKCYSIINYFAANSKANPLIPIISNIFSFFSKVVIAHSQENKSESNLASVLKLNPYFAKDYVAAVKVFSFRKSIDIIDAIKIADLKSKGVDAGNINEEGIMKELIFKILH
jgi:DNA polymerase-3 subunit delta